MLMRFSTNMVSFRFMHLVLNHSVHFGLGKLVPSWIPKMAGLPSPKVWTDVHKSYSTGHPECNALHDFNSSQSRLVEIAGLFTRLTWCARWFVTSNYLVGSWFQRMKNGPGFHWEKHVPSISDITDAMVAPMLTSWRAGIAVFNLAVSSFDGCRIQNHTCNCH